MISSRNGDRPLRFTPLWDEGKSINMGGAEAISVPVITNMVANDNSEQM